MEHNPPAYPPGYVSSADLPRTYSVTISWLLMKMLNSVRTGVKYTTTDWSPVGLPAVDHSPLKSRQRAAPLTIYLTSVPLSHFFCEGFGRNCFENLPKVKINSPLIVNTKQAGLYHKSETGLYNHRSKPKSDSENYYKCSKDSNPVVWWD